MHIVQYTNKPYLCLGLQEQDKDQTIGIVGLVIFMIVFVAVVGSCIVYIVIMECKRGFKRYTKLPSR